MGWKFVENDIRVEGEVYVRREERERRVKEERWRGVTYKESHQQKGEP